MKWLNVNCLNNVIAVIAVLLVFSCGSNKNLSAGEQNELDSLAQRVEKKNFQIVNRWANPGAGNNVDLVGNDNHIKFKNDSVKVYLPYFGVRHRPKIYRQGEGGIIFKGIPKNFKIEKLQEMMQINFEGNHRNENLQFNIRIYPNGNVYTNVNSSDRRSIAYRGEIMPLTDWE